MSDAVISIGGGAGTLQRSVAYRMKMIILVTGYGGWTDGGDNYLDERQLASFVRGVDNARDAVRYAVAAAKEQTDGKI